MEVTPDPTNPKDLVAQYKVPLDLFPAAGLIHGARAMKHGADKYGPFNWRDQKVQSMIYLGASIRHIYAFIDGEDCAVDSGINHLGHAVAGLAILLDAFETDNVIDNRPVSGAAARLLEQFKDKKV